MANTSEINGIYIPKFLVYTLTLVGIIDNTICSFSNFIIDLMLSIALGRRPSSNIQENQTPAPIEPPLSAILIREHLPSVKFSNVVRRNDGGGDEQAPLECAICLYEFEHDEEIRCLKNCQHFFHRDCIDRWMDQERKTCPLCRKSLVPVDSSRREFDLHLWADLYPDGCFNNNED
ncbi:hypothetical protein Leryth_000096 [Lithospermum erythrorhizon]|uniref:RING-type domain-containing protein n=1 Tax=Lithospermum erythrorhizon TaxID=34254 RepID=A0AAV3RJH0_LITER|nr:hypothetical protein Leryth_000096 [Lithospermum erythrorhizon]